MTPVTVGEAHASLPDLFNRVADGKEIVISCHCKPVAELLSKPIAMVLSTIDSKN